MRQIPPRTDKPPFRSFSLRNLDDFVRRYGLDADTAHVVRVVGSVLPFKTNSYVCDELVDWSSVPDDPIYQLTVPQREMLEPETFSAVEAALADGTEACARVVRDIRARLNPHPSGQMQDNVPHLGGRPQRGMQHKYRETVLFFPAQGQTCHAYCTYCFRWPQFTGDDDLRFAAREVDELIAYLRAHPDVTNVLVTGGDPAVMRTQVLQRYLEPLLAPEFAHVDIRIGTKAPAYWPHRFSDGEDADDLLRLFESVVRAGRHLAVMAHYSHPRELSTEVARTAVRRITQAGAVVRTQAPLIAHVNDDSRTWAQLWTEQVRLGAVPYYMFVERNTGAQRYFAVPLAQGFDIFTGAYREVPGLCRTARGPVMSATSGKVLVDGVTRVGDDHVFVLKMLQARDAAQANEVFFARFDAEATWFDDLRPALGSDPALFPHLPKRRRLRAVPQQAALPYAPGDLDPSAEPGLPRPYTLPVA